MGDDLYDLAPKDGEKEEPQRSAAPLRRTVRDPEKAIDQDRPCPHCGYNLKGLEVGGRCPECGAGIAPKRAKKAPSELPFHETPAAYMRSIQLGFALLSIGWIALAFTAIAGVRLLGPILAPLASLSLIWVGVALVCAPRPLPPDETRSAEKTRRLRWTKLRMGVVVTQVGAPIALFALGLLRPNAPVNWFSQSYTLWNGNPPIDGWGVGIEVLAWTWTIGFGLLALLASRFADWMADEERGRSLVLVAFWLPAICLIEETLDWITFWMSNPPLQMAMVFIGVILLIVNVVAFGYFWWALLQISRSAGWAPRTRRMYRERDERLLERVRAERAAAAAERERTEPFGGPLDFQTGPRRQGPERGDFVG